jgi:hypothetical protein
LRENLLDRKETVLGNSITCKGSLFSKDTLKKISTMDGGRVVCILANTKMVFITAMVFYQTRILIIKDIFIEDNRQFVYDEPQNFGIK